MRVIVPGASGFIGKNLLLNAPKDWEIIAVYNEDRDFLEFLEKHELGTVTPIKCDLTDEKEVEETFKIIGDELDICVYLAGNTLIPYSVENPKRDLTINTIALLNFLEHYRGEKLIYFSSGAVYDGLTGLVSPKMKVSPKVPYAISKLASENYIKFYQHRKKTFDKYVILRFFGAYGPHEPPRKIYTKLVNAFYLEDKNEFTMYGNGKNYIDAMYVDDTIECILKIIKDDRGNLTLDFCSGKPLTINELVVEAGRIFGKDDIKINHGGITEEYISFCVSPDEMKQVFGFEPTTPLEEGLQKLARHLEEANDGR